jgi:hypothetical protein
VSLDQVEKDKKRALRPYEDRPVGCPPAPDFSAMTEVEREAGRDTVGKLRELVKEAKGGDTTPLPEIREILRESPDLAWQIMNYGKVAEWHFVERMTGEEDLGSKEVLTNQLAAMRAEVAGENPSPLERLLAERVVATWLQVQLFEGLYAAGMYQSTSPKQENYQHKRLDRAHRNHLSAIRTLAQIRKLGPSIQINIAERQINTAKS